MAKSLIPEQVVEEIRSRNELVSVVEQYVKLEKRSGSNFFGLCPFHREDTPSFSVSPGKQIFYCFGCHKGGNVVNFIMEIEKCSYPESLRILAERAGIDIPESDDEQYRIRMELVHSITAILIEAARYYFHVLNSPEGSVARDYLAKRGVTESTRRRFGLGYSPSEWDGLYRHLQAKGYHDQELLLKSGLFRKGKNDSLYDLFRSRLMFPIFDALGRVIAFGGRVLDDSLPKYINSPETPVYTKGRHLYALNLAKASREKRLVIVEGYMDALSMHQAGIDFAVASLGTALTPNQALLIRKYTEEVIIGFDADAAGQSAAIRSLETLSARGLKVTVLIVPDGKDPDEFIRRHGPERFRVLVDQSIPLMDFKLLVAQKAHMTGDELNILDYQNEACSILAAEENAVVRELYAAKVAAMLKTSTDSVMTEVERRRQNPVAGPKHDVLRERLVASEKQEESSDTSTETLTREELYLLSLLASEPELYTSLDPVPRTDHFSEGSPRLIAEKALPLVTARTITPARLIDLAADLTFSGHSMQELLARAAMGYFLPDNRTARVEAAREFWTRHLFKKLKQSKKELETRLEIETDPVRREKMKSELLVMANELARRG